VTQYYASPDTILISRFKYRNHDVRVASVTADAACFSGILVTEAFRTVPSVDVKRVGGKGGGERPSTLKSAGQHDATQANRLKSRKRTGLSREVDRRSMRIHACQR